MTIYIYGRHIQRVRSVYIWLPRIEYCRTHQLGIDKISFVFYWFLFYNYYYCELCHEHVTSQMFMNLWYMYVVKHLFVSLHKLSLQPFLNILLTYCTLRILSEVDLNMEEDPWSEQARRVSTPKKKPKIVRSWTELLVKIYTYEQPMNWSQNAWAV